MAESWLWIILFLLGLTLSLTLVRLFAGPTLYDRVLAVNALGTQTLILLASWAVHIGRSDLMDIVLLYALINFVAVIAILKFFRYRSLRIKLLPQRDESQGEANG